MSVGRSESATEKMLPAEAGGVGQTGPGHGSRTAQTAQTDTSASPESPDQLYISIPAPAIDTQPTPNSILDNAYLSSDAYLQGRVTFATKNLF